MLTYKTFQIDFQIETQWGFLAACHRRPKKLGIHVPKKVLLVLCVAIFVILEPKRGPLFWLEFRPCFGEVFWLKIEDIHRFQADITTVNHGFGNPQSIGPYTYPHLGYISIHFDGQGARGFTFHLVPHGEQTHHKDLPCLGITLPETNIALKIGYSKRKLVFQPSIFRCYVSFREGKCPMWGRFKISFLMI